VKSDRPELVGERIRHYDGLGMILSRRRKFKVGKDIFSMFF